MSVNVADPVDVLRVLTAVAAVNGRLDAHASADETMRMLYILGDASSTLEPGDAQRMGSWLAALERRALVESRDEGWGKMWRLSPRVLALFEDGRS